MSSSDQPAPTHLRFIDQTIYCGQVKRRIRLDAEHDYGDAFTCPACGAQVPERRTKPKGWAETKFI